MYCMKCGVELEKGEKVCPLCGLQAYHPQLGYNDGKKSYPVSKVPSYETVNRKGLLLLITAIFLIPIVVTLLCDFKLTGSFSWSGYVVGSVILVYVAAVLPSWFKNPNPVIFVPSVFAAIVLFLLYIDIATGDEWFLSFAFPAVGALGIIVTAIVTILKYVKKGYWFIAGGGILAIGAYTVLIEFLLYVTFGIKTNVPWSTYPLLSCIMIGGALLTIGISKPLRRKVQKRFFI